MSKPKIIGLARTVDVDVNAEGTICRVRLFDSSGVPTGKVLTGVQLASAVIDKQLLATAQQDIASFPNLSDHELDTAARQNLYYNSHLPVEIE